MNDDPSHAFDYGCEQVGAIDFDWDAVDRACAEDIKEFRREIQNEPLTQEEIDRIAKALQVLIKWVFIGRTHNSSGLQLRMLTIAWQVLPELHGVTLTKLAEKFGKDKQSFGRQVARFKQSFPWARSPHFQPGHEKQS